jgi:hypothetical protein
MMKKKLAIFLGLLLFLLPLFSVSSSDEKASNPKKMSFLEGKLYVLSPRKKLSISISYLVTEYLHLI